MAFVTQTQFQNFRALITDEMNTKVSQFQILLASADQSFRGVTQRLDILDQYLVARIRDLDDSKQRMEQVVQAVQLRAEESYSKILGL